MLDLMAGFGQAFRASIRSHKAFSITFASALLMFVLLVLSSFPEYSYQLVAANPLLIFTAVAALTGNLSASSGVLAVFLTIIYSIVGGVAISNLVDQFRLQSSGVKEAGLLSPGLVVSGCAGCGAGVLGLVGLGGALASLPFQGNLVRAGGILLLVFFLGRTGDPTKCSVE